MAHILRFWVYYSLFSVAVTVAFVGVTYVLAAAAVVIYITVAAHTLNFNFKR